MDRDAISPSFADGANVGDGAIEDPGARVGGTPETPKGKPSRPRAERVTMLQTTMLAPVTRSKASLWELLRDELEDLSATGMLPIG